MRKQNSISYSTSPIFFDDESDADAGATFFKVFNGSDFQIIDMPTAIAHRLYRLGQAYGFRQMRYFESDVRIVVGTVEIPEFIRDLGSLRALVNDEVLHKFIRLILDALEAPPGPDAKHVAVKIGNYFDPRGG